MVNLSGISHKELFHVSLTFQCPSMISNYKELSPYDISRGTQRKPLSDEAHTHRKDTPEISYIYKMHLLHKKSKSWGSEIQLYRLNQKDWSATVKIWCGESFLKKHWWRCHRNEFWLWSWTQGMKIQIGCWEWTRKKRRECNDSKDDLLRNSTGRSEFAMDNSVCIKWEMSGPSMTGEKKN